MAEITKEGKNRGGVHPRQGRNSRVRVFSALGAKLPKTIQVSENPRLVFFLQKYQYCGWGHTPIWVIVPLLWVMRVIQIN